MTDCAKWVRVSGPGRLRRRQDVGTGRASGSLGSACLEGYTDCSPLLPQLVVSTLPIGQSVR